MVSLWKYLGRNLSFFGLEDKDRRDTWASLKKRYNAKSAQHWLYYIKREKRNNYIHKSESLVGLEWKNVHTEVKETCRKFPLAQQSVNQVSLSFPPCLALPDGPSGFELDLFDLIHARNLQVRVSVRISDRLSRCEYLVVVGLDRSIQFRGPPPRTRAGRDSFPHWDETFSDNFLICPPYFSGSLRCKSKVVCFRGECTRRPAGDTKENVSVLVEVLEASADI